MPGPALALVLVSAMCLAVGCASSSSWVDHCDSGPRPQPSDECVALPETRATAARLEALISEVADPLAVLVEFDDAGKVGPVCSIRSAAPKQWEGQAKLSNHLQEIRDTPAGPACLAGKTLVFNVKGAIVGRLKADLRDCEAGEAGMTGEYDRLCVEMTQLSRGELWFFNTRRDYPYVFQPGPEASERHQALFQCSDDPGLVRVTEPEFKMGFTYGLASLTKCMEGLGWKQTL